MSEVPLQRRNCLDASRYETCNKRLKILLCSFVDPVRPTIITSLMDSGVHTLRVLDSSRGGVAASGPSQEEHRVWSGALFRAKAGGCVQHTQHVYWGTSLIRNCPPPRTTVGP